MSKRKPLPEILNCRCGNKAAMNQVLGFAVYCSNEKCWIGAERKSKRGAINEWNKVMKP